MNPSEKPLQNARKTRILPTSQESDMNKAHPIVHPRKIYKNLSIDPEVAKLFDLYCEANRKAGSPSAEVQEFMIRTIERKGRVYGLRLPQRLILK